METTSKEKRSPGSGESVNGKQTDGNEKDAGRKKEWWEHLAGTIPEDKEEQRKWFRWLTNPLVIVTGLIALGYWWFSKKQKHYAILEKENEGLKSELSWLKKKYKKLKKKARNTSRNNGKTSRYTVLE